VDRLTFGGQIVDTDSTSYRLTHTHNARQASHTGALRTGKRGHFELTLRDFIEPLGIPQHRVSVAIGVPPRRINEIVHGERRIIADTALRLSRYFGTAICSA
jgi:addiction module HigA family antidote